MEVKVKRYKLKTELCGEGPYSNIYNTIWKDENKYHFVIPDMKAEEIFNKRYSNEGISIKHVGYHSERQIEFTFESESAHTMFLLKWK